MPNLLAFDTSTDACSAALLYQGKITGRYELAPRRHTELLLPMVDELLAEAGIVLSDLQAIAFGCGPGSFMGTRLATGVAQGLAFGAELPVIAVSSLQCIAQHAYQQLDAKHIIAAWDARMAEIYWGCYALDGNQLMMPLGQDQVSKPENICVPENAPWVLAGNAWQLYQAELPSSLQLESHLFHPRASAMLKLAAYQYQSGGFVSANEAEPNYLRRAVT